MKIWIQHWLCVALISLTVAQIAQSEERVWEEGILVLTDSPVFDGFLFDHEQKVLTVYFCTGEVMEYRDVACATYQSLMNAEDRVTWFSDHIYRAHPCRRIASAFRPSHKTTQPHNNKEISHAFRQSSRSSR